MKLGETLAGDVVVKSLYELRFREPLSDVQLCEKTLTAVEVDSFILAIRNRFVYELLLDNLPMKLFVGDLGDGDTPARIYLYTHTEFVISVNRGDIIEASATPVQPVELNKGQTAKVRFSYSVKWEEVRTSTLSPSAPVIMHCPTLLPVLVIVLTAIACSRRHLHNCRPIFLTSAEQRSIATPITVATWTSTGIVSVMPH